MNSQVEQVDRLSYADYIRMKIGVDTDESYISRLLNGEMDWTHGVQIARVARHRLAALASQPPVLDEREVIERCAKVADEEVAARRGQQKMAVINNFLGGQLDAALRIATAIRNLGGPERKTVGEQCTMGVGCDQYGVCYADAHGQPEQCPAIRNLGGPDDVA